MDYTSAFDVLRLWATGRPDVRALVLTGSAATGTEHPLSGRDIQVFATDIPALPTDESWWSAPGKVLVVERLTDDDGNPTRLVHYAGGKIDFALLPAFMPPERVYERCWADIHPRDAERALLATVEPYRALAKRTAKRLGAPQFAHERALRELRSILTFAQ